MTDERWTPVIIKHHGKAFENDVYKKYEVSNKCRIRRTTTKRISQGKTEVFGFCGAGKRYRLRIHRVCLSSFYPNDIPHNVNDYDCDHIDGNHHNMILENLQWLKRDAHRRKTIDQTLGKRKRRVYKNTHTQEIIKGEIFRKYNGYEFSNLGRIKTKKGYITRGRNQLNSKYRTFLCKLDTDSTTINHMVHVLVWRAFNGEVPEGMIVMHNDNRETLDEEGYERNWLIDLSVGTQGENVQSYHDNRLDLKKVRCLNNGTVYRCAAEAGRKLGIVNTGAINRVCRKLRKSYKGYTFEYF